MPVTLNTPDHKTLPGKPTEQPNLPVNPQVQKMVDTNAKSKLKQKNRKKNEMVIELAGLALNFEAATKYNMVGFTPNADAEDWILGEVEFRARGKQGSETTLTFFPSAAAIINV